MTLQIILRNNSIFNFQKHAQFLYSFSTSAIRNKQKKQIQPRVSPTLQLLDMGKSLAAKGFLRSVKPYTPSVDVEEKISTICTTMKIPNEKSHKLRDLKEKFKFLEACYKNFQHSVPNSQVYELTTVADVVEFYKTTVDNTVPYDAFKNIDLPENLHIQYDYLRFHPDTDTKFKGQTAFPKSSTLVTGLKYRGKYQGYEAKRSWP